MSIYLQKGGLYYLDKEHAKVTVFGPFSDIEAVLQNQIERVPEITKKITCYAIAAPTNLVVESPPCLFAPPEE